VAQVNAPCSRAYYAKPKDPDTEKCEKNPKDSKKEEKQEELLSLNF
jgi:hypothetical protein